MKHNVSEELSNTTIFFYKYMGKFYLEYFGIILMEQ